MASSIPNLKDLGVYAVTSTRWNREIRANDVSKGSVRLLIDTERVARTLGDRALHNRSGRAVLAGGLIVVEVVQRG